MDRKRQHVRAWWLLGVLFLASLMPQPVGATSPEPDMIKQGTTYLPFLQKPAVAPDLSWPMAGANPQRTSWTPEEVRGQLHPVWFRPIEPFIAQKTQIIAANDLLYISTAKGIYALRTDTGAIAWVYPTEMPIGHSPTVQGSTLYVGGFDHRLHALDANPNPALLPSDSTTGYKINNRVHWTFEAEAGFQTNPLVANNLVYLGNRDGYMYAVYSNDYPDIARRGTLAWKFKTGGPVLFSAALSKDGETVYFASNDMHAYALNALTGNPIWFHMAKEIQQPGSAKLPGDGFHSWWPVVYTDSSSGKSHIIFAGSHAYRHYTGPRAGPDMQDLQQQDIFGDYDQNNPALEDYRGSLRSPQLTSGAYAGWLDTNRPNTFGTITARTNTSYYKQKPWRRTYFVLDGQSGEETLFDFDGDGKKQEYAPILWHGTHSGNRFPPVVGADNNLYQSNMYMFERWISAGHVSGWKFGTPYISTPSQGWVAMDEPMAYSGGGNLVYWTQCCDRGAGSIDVASPYTNPREWSYFNYNIDDLVPRYNIMYDAWRRRNDLPGPYGGPNGVYSSHGDQNAPIPYKGRVYVHRSNAIIAFGLQTASNPLGKPLASTVSNMLQSGPTIPTTDQLKQKLAVVVSDTVQAGHLRPAWGHAGLFDNVAENQCGDSLMDYWHDPSDAVYYLLLALPHLPADLQTSTKAYIQSELRNYPPSDITHIGWSAGATRDYFDLPPEEEAAARSRGATPYGNFNWNGWTKLNNYGGVNPFRFYALWRYSQQFSDPSPQTLIESSKKYLSDAPSDSILAEYPFAHNAYIAGFLGYLELGKKAGYLESQLLTPNGKSVKGELDRLLALRAAAFSKDTAVDGYCRTLAVSRNFMYLVPELADYLRGNALAKVQQALQEYTKIAPYWFVAKTEQTMDEGVGQPIFDTNALFQAKALILKEPRGELSKYLDVSTFAHGDLWYIQNLVTAIEAGSTPAISAAVAVPADSSKNLSE